MEYVTVEVKVPKGFMVNGRDITKYRLMISARVSPRAGETHISYISGDSRFSLIACNNKPDWNPPKLKKGYVTWDETGWQWWPIVPRAKSSDGWINTETGGADNSYYFNEEMRELLGVPDCAGYEWSECIWEVGN